MERIGNRGHHARRAYFTEAGRPRVTLDELDVQFFWRIRHTQQVVIVEIRLLDRAILQRDALVQCGREAVDDAALDVGLRGLRGDDDAAVSRDPDFVHPDLAVAGVQGDFDDAGAERS